VLARERLHPSSYAATAAMATPAVTGTMIDLRG
jgi:hypothetical protein